ncbi:glycosyltransferase family 4 protein [Fulvivirgaceae bacterium BMA12]|uniref:Glycosyltransferase family 4 protein n=1 Tax=Agaribacillus aureus TaxID=3051825 RepID=A0ABT8LHE8_9BACT|nr:glycosyltransferase family 4 protein [Fulvivirgaceae bacterium BMA12]
MIKILMFGWEYPPNITGGLGTTCYELTKALTGKGVGINFVMPQSIEGNGLHASGQSIIKIAQKSKENLLHTLSDLHHLLSIPSKLSPYALQPDLSTVEQEQALNNQLQSELDHFTTSSSSAIKGLDYDLIHAHDWPTYGAALQAQKVSHKPLILHVHSTEADRRGNHMNRLIFELEKAGFTMADNIITVSNYTKNTLIDHYQVDPEKIEVIYHGVPSGFDNSERTANLPEFNEKIITFCGRITWQKGPSYFVNAAFKLAEENDQIRFIMAGDGDLREEMIELTADLGLSRRFHFPGFLTREEVKRLWQISDLLVMPSVSEPFGLTALEAMAAGVPVIISRQSGISELFPHILKADYWETHTLATLIHQLINDPQMIAQQKEKNQTQLARLSWTTSAEQIIKLYHSLKPRL